MDMVLPDKTAGRPRSKFFVSRRELATVIVGAFGFFIGRAVVFTFVNPLSVAFLATFMGAGYVFYMTALFIALGLATRLRNIFIARYLIAIGIMCVYHYLAERLLTGRKAWLKPYAQAAAAALCTLVAGIVAAVMYGNSTYLLMVALVETVLSGSVTLIIKRANVILTARRRRTALLSGEDMIALAIVLAGVIAGASDVYVGSVSLRFFLCLYVLFIVAHKGGAAMGGACGMLLGFFLHMAGYWDIAMCAVWGLAGMSGGFVRKLNRLLVIPAVCVAGAATMYCLLRSQLSFPLLYAAICAGLAFMLTPQGFSFNVTSAIDPVLDNAGDYMDKIKEETTRRLDSFASAFEKLAATFSGLSKPKNTLNKNDISQLIDDLAARACAVCERRAQCWEDEFYYTYQQVFALLDVCVKQGEVTPEDMDETFRTSCADPEIFLKQLNMVFALYRSNMRWNNRISESRELVSQQLYGVSGIIRRLSDEIDMSLRFHEGLEEEMIAALLKNKIEVSSVIVLENKAGKYQVTVSHKPCYGKKVCINDIIPVLNAVLKRKMRMESDGCSTRNDVCTARFIEESKLRVTCGVAHRAKHQDSGSGDSYSFMELKNGQCLMALSDGMGSGARARRESAATVGLLEDFIESGFEKELAVRMINSVLVLKSSEESFSTLDICSVDLYTGDAEFIKIGAASTFLLRNGKVSVIRSSSLPMGMLNDVDLEVSTRTLIHNDIILMATDGVTEAVQGVADREDWLMETLRNCRYRNPQDVADYILDEANRASGEEAGDDMTVLAARVWEKVI